MRLKEANFKQAVEISGYQERNLILKEQLIAFRQRITELEKETIAQTKENYSLNCELDYETVKSRDLKSKNDSIMAGVNLHKDLEVREREKLVAQYEKRTFELETKMKLEKQPKTESVGEEI